MVADRERRAPGDARPRRDDRPERLPRPRRHRPGRARGAPAHRARRDRRRARPRRLHADPGPQRRLQGRPDDHAAGARALPDRHRRRARDGRPEVVLRPAAAGRLGAAHGRDRGLVHGRRLGAAGARPRRLGDERRRLARGLSVRSLPRGRAGRRARAGLPDLLRRRARLGALRADGGRSGALGRPLGGRAAARSRAGGHRRLRDDRADREGLSRVRHRARVRVQRRRGRHDAPEGEGARLRRQGGVPAPPGGGAGGDHVHADGRRPDLVVRRQALHARARADPDRRTASGSSTARGVPRTSPPPARARPSASTC